MNYEQPIEKTGLVGQKQALDDKKTGLYEKKQVVETMISGLNVSAPTRKNIMELYDNFGFDVIFTRADVMKITGLTATPASELMRKLKGNNLIEGVKGRGKYKFIEPKE